MRILRLQITRTIAAAALLALGLMAGCGNDKQKDDLEGAIGPGAGGPAVSGTVANQTLTKPNGSALGSMSYDSIFFTPTPAAPTAPTSLDNSPNNVHITLTPISGRIDTPCRFNAATLARDQGYGIGHTGFRANSSAQDLYEVDFDSGPTALRLFCISLRDGVGLQFAITADAPDKVAWLQVYYVLNSLHP